MGGGSPTCLYDCERSGAISIWDCFIVSLLAMTREIEQRAEGTIGEPDTSNLKFFRMV